MNAINLRALTMRSASFVTTLALASLPGATFGAAITWDPDSDGFWDNPTNWSSNPSLPGAGDDVTIDVGGSVVRVITHRTGTTTIRTIKNAETVDVTNASTLNISSGGLGSTNTGTLQANNGTLNLINSALNNAGGTLSAINSGRINLSSGTVITGGTLSTASSGAILTAVGTSATLNGVTLASGAQFIGSNASTTTLIGTINNGGTITLSSGGNATDLAMSGNVTLTGSGGVLMGNGINNRILGAGRLINDFGHTIQGGGQIGVNQIAITNSGLIVANQPAGMVIDPNATGMINTGTVRVTGGATLDLTGSGGGSFTNTGGTIEAQNGSTVRLVNGAAIVAGRRRGSGKRHAQWRDGLERQSVRRRIQQPDDAAGHDYQQRHDGAGLDRTVRRFRPQRR
jgi:fibronectin-binding autotransporter adhesin